MKEISFRGKRDDGKWLYGSLVTGLFGEEGEQAHILDPDNGYYDCFDHFDSPDYEVDPDTVGQFTGCLDALGVKIFKGDIIKFLEGMHGVDNAEVVFNGGAFCIDTQNDEVDLMPLAWTPVEFLKVVGNIHDNPELLDEE